MKTINLDGETYVMQKDIDKEYVLKSLVDEELKDNKKRDFQIISSSFSLMEELNILAIGSFQLGEGWVTTKISTEFLDRVIRCLKAMSNTERGLEDIELAWAKDFPAIIGTRNNKGQMSGFIIAPKIDIK